MAVDPDFLSILCCPKCRSPVAEAPGRPAGSAYACRGAGCGLVYSVRDGILVLLESEAEPPSGKPEAGASEPEPRRTG
jgi:uncharacterized protein YbaR (Trm112 family)